MTQRNARSRRLTAAALWSLAILAGCTIPGDALRSMYIFTPDKLYHIAAFAGYALLWMRAGVRLRTIIATGLLFGVFIEVWQHTLPIGRSADPYDALADAIGLALGVAAGTVATRAKATRLEQREMRQREVEQR